MTNIEALRANIGGVHGINLDDDHFEKALVDEGIMINEQYHKGNAIYIDKATIKLYEMILGSSSVSEGAIGYNVNKAEVRRVKEELEIRTGLKKGRNQIRGVSPW
jgi:hypothetical protein